MKKDNQSSVKSGLIVCKLSGSAFQKRKAALQEKIFSQVQLSTELANGYTFYFKDEGDFAQELLDYVLAEKKCCSFLQFDISIQANNAGLALKVTGPEGAKEMIKSVSNQLKN